MNERQEFFVSTASCVGALGRVKQTAAELSLAAKNAKAIAYRAGTAAVGFKPLTDYIDEMGRTTARLVTEISREALTVARQAVDDQRLQEALVRLQRGRDQILTPQEGLDRAIASVRSDVEAARANSARGLRRLLELLDDISHTMRAAGVISTRARVEATQAGIHEDSLRMVADKVERAAGEIRTIIARCERQLRDAA